MLNFNVGNNSNRLHAAIQEGISHRCSRCSNLFDEATNPVLFDKSSTGKYVCVCLLCLSPDGINRLQKHVGRNCIVLFSGSNIPNNLVFNGIKSISKRNYVSIFDMAEHDTLSVSVKIFDFNIPMKKYMLDSDLAGMYREGSFPYGCIYYGGYGVN